MSAARLMGDASELEIITELHSPIAIDPSESGLAEDGLSRPTHSDADPHTSKLERRNNLRVDTQLGHVRFRPSAIIENSDRPSSSSTTSEVDADETRSRRPIRSVMSLPSFHLPNRARPNSYRDRRGDTPPLTSASLSSLTGSGSPISSSSGLCTPPHSPPAAALVHTEITSPSSHLPAIIELPNTEDHVQRLFLQPKEAKSAQTLTRTERPGPSSSSESDGQGQPRQTIHMYRSNTDSSTGTVTGLAFPSPPPTSDPVPPRTQQRQQQQLLKPLTRSPSPASLASLTSTSSRVWPFGGGRNKSRGVAGSLSKAEKAEMKKRKKAEARAHKEHLALELKRYSAADEASLSSGRSNERTLNSRAWEEDIAVYGSLASM